MLTIASGAWVWSFSDLCHVSLSGVVVVRVTDLAQLVKKMAFFSPL